LYLSTGTAIQIQARVQDPACIHADLINTDYCTTKHLKYLTETQVVNHVKKIILRTTVSKCSQHVSPEMLSTKV